MRARLARRVATRLARTSSIAVRAGSLEPIGAAAAAHERQDVTFQLRRRLVRGRIPEAVLDGEHRAANSQWPIAAGSQLDVFRAARVPVDVDRDVTPCANTPDAALLPRRR